MDDNLHFQKAADNNFGQSLFSRLYDFYNSADFSGVNPVFMLDTQYRMHEEIVSFPSKQFYKSKLLTSW